VRYKNDAVTRLRSGRPAGRPGHLLCFVSSSCRRRTTSAISARTPRSNQRRVRRPDASRTIIRRVVAEKRCRGPQKHFSAHAAGCRRHKAHVDAVARSFDRLVLSLPPSQIKTENRSLSDPPNDAEAGNQLSVCAQQ